MSVMRSSAGKLLNSYTCIGTVSAGFDSYPLANKDFMVCGSTFGVASESSFAQVANSAVTSSRRLADSSSSSSRVVGCGFFLSSSRMSQRYCLERDLCIACCAVWLLVSEVGVAEVSLQSLTSDLSVKTTPSCS